MKFFGKKMLDPDKLLLKQYSMRKRDRIGLIARGTLLGLLATPIGSAIYFLITQTDYHVGYPKKGQTFANVYLAHTWDHLINAPWWDTARHDVRKVLIGFLAMLLIGAVTIGFKQRKRASPTHMVLSVPFAFVAAIATAGALILFFNWAVPSMQNWGLGTNEATISQWIGSGTLQLTAIGLAAGFVAKRIMHRTFDTVQLMSLENKIKAGKTEQWWWKIVYPPNYRRRFQYLVAANHQGPEHKRWLGITISLAAPFLTFLLAFGIWLDYFGPAAHVHG